MSLETKVIEISPMKSDRPNAKASSPEKPESKSMLGSFIEMLTGPSVRNLKLDEEEKQYILTTINGKDGGKWEQKIANQTASIY